MLSSHTAWRLDVPVKLLRKRRTEAPLFARQPSAQRPSRLSSSCLAGSLGDSERDRRSRSQPRSRCPGSAASRSTFLPTSWSAPREPAPESSLLGRSRPRASARRPSRRSMCGRACTPRTRAAARARTGAGSRLAAWPARPFKFLSHSGLGGCQASSKYRLTRRSWPERVATEAQLATGASSATQAFALG